MRSYLTARGFFFSLLIPPFRGSRGDESNLLFMLLSVANRALPLVRRPSLYGGPIPMIFFFVAKVV